MSYKINILQFFMLWIAGVIFGLGLYAMLELRFAYPETFIFFGWAPVTVIILSLMTMPTKLEKIEDDN